MKQPPKPEIRCDRNPDGTVDDLFIGSPITHVSAEMMSEDCIMILVGHPGQPGYSRLSVWAKRGRWPWSAPVLASLFEENY